MANEPLQLVIAKFSGGVGRSGVGAGDFSVQDIRELQKRLKAIEPRLRTELVRDVKRIARPLESDIKSAIPNIAPLSGMAKDRGRLGWGVGVAANKTLIQFRTSGGGKSLTTSLVRVKVSSPATVLADMAGRSGRYVGQGRRNDNASPSEKRRNASPAKGAKFIESLNRALGSGASRMAWPAAEKSRDAVRSAIEQVLRQAFDRINQKGL
jgi:hypothetical protein